MLYLNQHKNNLRTGCRRAFSVLLCAAVTVSAAGLVPAEAAAGEPTCDEAYYGTLDYYGALADGGVVKSYHLNGASSVTDYGKYTSIVNMTNDLKPAADGNKTTFNFANEKDKPETFYFEGKTAQPYKDLPWNIKISYRLNGVDAKAEDLAGKTGLVEINVDLTPNKSSTASDYFKNNLVLTGLGAFNADDIVSLEAEGAQVQLVGNLRAVMFMALPGEAQHVSIRVGTNSFTSDGLTFLAVPATLSQLDKITTLRKDKNKAEDSYNDISASLDTILNALDGMSGSLNGAADGLDELNEARASLSAAKGEIDDSLDLALTSFDTLSDALTPLTKHLDTASQAVGDFSSRLTSLTNTAVSLKTQLANCRTGISALQSDAAKLSALSSSLESQSSSVTTALFWMNSDLSSLNTDLSSLQSSLSSLNSTLTYLKNNSALSQMSLISVNGTVVPTDQTALKAMIAQVDGYYKQADALHTAYKATAGGAADTTDSKFGDYVKEQMGQLYELWAAEQAAGGKAALDAQLDNVNILHAAYVNYLAQHSQTDPNDTGFKAFITEYLVQQGADPATADANAQNLSTLWSTEKALGGKDALNAQLDNVNKLHDSYTAYLKAHNTTDANDTNFQAYIQNTLAPQLTELWVTGTSLGGVTGMNQMLMQASSANAALAQANTQLSAVNSLISTLSGSTSSTVSSLKSLCGTLGSGGVTSDLKKLISLLNDAQTILNQHKGETSAAVQDINGMGTVISDMTKNADLAIDQIKALDDTLNSYVPETQSALSDGKKAASNLSSGVKNTDAALKKLKSVVSAQSSKVDAGTKKALSGISSSLRQAAGSLNGTGTLRTAKSTLTGLIDSEWKNHTGGSDNMLNMDPSATPVSLTSAQNGTPKSIQLVLRTKEIKVDTKAEEKSAASATSNQNFWQRLGGIFVGLWNDFTGLFKH